MQFTSGHSPQLTATYDVAARRMPVRATFPAGLFVTPQVNVADAIEALYATALPSQTWSLKGKVISPGGVVSVNAHVDVGACTIPEDRISLIPHLMCVADGVSPGYVPGSQPKNIAGMSYGRYAAEVLARCVQNSDPQEPLDSVIRRASKILYKEFTSAGCNTEHPAEFGATTGALCKIGNEVVELMSWGDAYFMVFLRDGSIQVSKNWVYHHDQDQNRMRAEIAKDETLDKAGIWKRFIPDLMKLRDGRVNNPDDEHGYGVLNGMRVEGLLQLTSRLKVPRENVLKIMLVTDGIVDIDNTHPQERFVRYMADARGTTQIEDLKIESFKASQARNDRTVVAAPEASGLLLTF